MRSSLEGVLPDEDSTYVPYLRNGRQYRIPPLFWETTMETIIPALDSLPPSYFMFDALGSMGNRDVMTIVSHALNQKKERVSNAITMPPCLQSKTQD